MIDAQAPIIPWVGMGNIKLYSTIRELRELLENEKEVSVDVYYNIWIVYEVKDIMSLFFHLVNGKLFRITTSQGYQGKLFDQIGVTTTEKEFLEIEPSFVYDDFEEIFESPKGILVETDPISKEAMWISVYIKELFDDDFEEAKW